MYIVRTGENNSAVNLQHQVLETGHTQSLPASLNSMPRWRRRFDIVID